MPLYSTSRLLPSAGAGGKALITLPTNLMLRFIGVSVENDGPKFGAESYEFVARRIGKLADTPSALAAAGVGRDASAGGDCRPAAPVHLWFMGKKLGHWPGDCCCRLAVGAVRERPAMPMPPPSGAGNRPKIRVERRVPRRSRARSRPGWRQVRQWPGQAE